MTLPSILAFSTAMLILAATPGPGVFATIARSLASGFKDTLPLIIGIIIGDILYLTFAVFGLSFIAQTMNELFTVVKIIGGIYLIYLGIKIWRSRPEIHLEKNGRFHTPWNNFFSGLLITLSNPKVILFYCGFLPTFVDLTSLGIADVGIIAVLVTIVLSGVLCTYSLAAGRTREIFQSSGAVRNLNRSSGTIMAVTGVVIATRT